MDKRECKNQEVITMENVKNTMAPNNEEIKKLAKEIEQLKKNNSNKEEVPKQFEKKEK